MKKAIYFSLAIFCLLIFLFMIFKEYFIFPFIGFSFSVDVSELQGFFLGDADIHAVSATGTVLDVYLNLKLQIFAIFGY